MPAYINKGGGSMSADSLSLIAGTVLSLTFSYVPGLHDRFDPLDATNKRLILLGLLVVCAGLIYELGCLGWGASWGIQVSCDRAGLASFLEQLVLAVIANQGTYGISPRRVGRVHGQPGL
jgi:hypothetical protein